MAQQESNKRVIEEFKRRRARQRIALAILILGLIIMFVKKKTAVA